MALLRTAPLACLAALAACASSDEPTPAPTPTPQTLYEALAGARIETGVPGAAAAIIRDGEPVFDGFVGDFSRSPGRPLERTSLFPLVGVTELATAPMTFRLVEDGRLSLDDRLSRYIPYVPNADQITIGMLLDHRSGIYDYFLGLNDKLYYPLHDPSHVWSRDEVLRALDGFPPSGGQRYSQSDYVVLGGVIERVTGRSIADYFDDVVAHPAGLEGCAFAFDPSRAHEVVHGFTLSQDKLVDTFPADGRVPTVLWGTVWTDRGLACDARDTARLADALFRGLLVGPETLTLMTTFGRDNYAYGVGEKSDGPARVWGHAGLGSGFSTAVWYEPERRLTIAVLANADTGGIPGTLYQRMEEAYTRGAR
jgi:D-alanyl-D-alanine carboxypeptidase